MSVLLNATFDTDAEGFSAGSRVASEGADFDTGYISIPTGTTATKSFTAASSGDVRLDFWVQVPDVETAGDTTKNAFFYLLPTAGSVLSSNAILTFLFSRNTALGATALLYNIGYCDNTGGTFTSIPQATLFMRTEWLKLGIVAHFTGHTVDLYLNDVLWLKGISWANTSAADISRVALVTAASSPATYYDEIRVESAWALSESTVIDHDLTTDTGEIETLLPDTDASHINAQPWKIADDTTNFGGFTVSSNGAAPDASKLCGAFIRGRPEGTILWEVKTSVAGRRWFAFAYRVWAGLESGISTDRAMNYVRYDSGATAGQEWGHFVGGADTDASIQNSGSNLLSANTTYTIRAQIYGRYVLIGMRSGTIAAGGGFTNVFAELLINSDATGARGQLSEDHIGFFVDTNTGATDNYVRRVQQTGTVPRTDITIGSTSWELQYGSVRGLYRSDTTLTTRNLFWSKGVQAMHRAEHDGGNYATPQRTVWSGTDVKSYQQRSWQLSEDLVAGYGDCYFTFTRRGLWVSDKTRVQNTTPNIAPDWDLRGELWDVALRFCAASGAGDSATDSGFHDWQAVGDGTPDVTAVALPMGMQRLTNAGSGNKIRATEIIGNIANWADTGGSMFHKWIGQGDPMSIAVLRESTVAGTSYELFRALYLESGALSLSETVCIGIRDDLATPATFTFTSGDQNTTVTGDTNGDGFNERYGWYEMRAGANGLIAFTLVKGTPDRYYPQFHITGLTSATGVSIAGSPGVAGTDFVLSQLGDSSYLLELLTVRTANTAIEVTGAAFPTGWTRRQPIVIQNAQVDGDLTNFPVLVTRAHLHDEIVSPTDANAAHSDGGDIRFTTDSAGTTLVPAELVTWTRDTSHGADDGVVKIFVKLPSVADASDTTFYIWYHGPSVVDFPGNSGTYGRNNVWSNGFVTVLHCSDANPSLGVATDSTGNANMTATAMESGDSVSGGIVGNQFNFDTSEYLTVADNARYEISPGLTAEVIFTADQVAARGGFMAKWDGTTNHRAWLFEHNLTVLRALVSTDGTFQAGNVASGATTLVAGTQYYAAFIMDGANTDMFVRLNAAQDGTNASGPATVFTTGTAPFIVAGADNNGGTPAQTLDGKLAEVRLSNVVRAAAWCNCTYRTLKTPATFAVGGTPEDVASGASIPIVMHHRRLMVA